MGFHPALFLLNTLTLKSALFLKRGPYWHTVEGPCGRISSRLVRSFRLDKENHLRGAGNSWSWARCRLVLVGVIQLGWGLWATEIK